MWHIVLNYFLISVASPVTESREYGNPIHSQNDELTLIAAGSKTDGLVSGLAQTSTQFFSAYEHRRISIEVSIS